MRARHFVQLGLTAVMALAACTAWGQATSAFTYQGRLTSSGTPQNGNFDFRFALWNDPTAGLQYGPTVSVNSLPVSAGLFTTQLDFGRVFDSTRLWLQIQVRPTGGGIFTTLAPRQEMTAAPYANGLSLPAYGSVNTGGYGLQVQNSTGSGILGTSGTTGDGVDGISYAPAGNGVIGSCSADIISFGVWGISSTGYGIVGSASGTAAAAGSFYSNSPNGYGVIGSYQGTGTAPGVEGDSYSTAGNASGVVGHVIGTAPGSYSAGVRGISDGTNAMGIGVWGSQNGSGCGVLGSVGGGGYGVVAQAGASGTGLYATGDQGVYGVGNSYAGVVGQTAAASTTLAGVNGYGQTGVRGDSGSGGAISFGVYGASTAPSGNGVRGDASGSGAYGIWGVGNNSAYAGFFNGAVNVVGTLSKSGGSFKIDHPLDPANKYLYHSFVESPDMMNIYNGNVTTDSGGYATVTLPDWFETLNRDFRYQLTVIDEANSDQFVQAKVVKTISGGQFTLRTSRPNAQVSWQVTGIRQDAWANANRIPVEQDKTGVERGRYIHPELFGQPAEMSINGWKVSPESDSPRTADMLPPPQAGMPAPATPAAAPALPRKTPPQLPANDVSAATPVNQVESDN